MSDTGRAGVFPEPDEDFTVDDILNAPSTPGSTLRERIREAKEVVEGEKQDRQRDLNKVLREQIIEWLVYELGLVHSEAYSLKMTFTHPTENMVKCNWAIENIFFEAFMTVTAEGAIEIKFRAGKPNDAGLCTSMKDVSYLIDLHTLL